MSDDDVVHEIREVLVRTAHDGGLITYSELLAALDDERRARAEAQLAPLLREVSTAEDEAGRGLLSAIVVNERDGLPGKGWFRLAADRGRDVRSPVDAWRDEVRRVHDAWYRKTPQVPGPPADQ